MIFYLISSIFTLYFIGNIFKIPSINNSKNSFGIIFIKLIIGLFISVSLYSLYQTNFASVSIVFLVILLLIVIRYFKNIKLNILINREEIKFFIYGAIIIIPIYLIQLIIIGNDQYLIDTDKLFYSRISYFLVENGFESIYNNTSNLFPEIFQGTTPYHYFELWLNSLLSNVFNLSSSITLCLFTYPLLIFYSFLGLLSILETYSEIKSLTYIVCFLLIWCSPFYLEIYRKLFENGNFFLNTTTFGITGHTYRTSPITSWGQKNLPITILFLFSYYMYRLKNKQISNNALLVMPIISIAMAPAIFTGLCISNFIKYLKTKNKKYFKSLIYTILIAFSILTFYFLTSSKGSHNTSTSMIYNFLEFLNIKGEILRFFFKIVVPVIWMLILYSPYIVLYLLHKKNIKIQLNSIDKKVLIIILSSIILFPFFKGLDASQFFTSTLPIFNVLILLKFVDLYHKEKVSKKSLLVKFLALISLTCIITLYNHEKFKTKILEQYSMNYNDKVKNFCKSNQESKIVRLCDTNKLKTTLVQQWHSLTTGRLYNQYGLFEIYNLDFSYTIDSLRTYSNNDHINLFCKVQQNINNEICQLEFIKEFNVDFLIVSKHAKPNKILSKHIELLFLDEKSGEKLYRTKI